MDVSLSAVYSTLDSRSNKRRLASRRAGGTRVVRMGICCQSLHLKNSDAHVSQMAHAMHSAVVHSQPCYPPAEYICT